MVIATIGLIGIGAAVIVGLIGAAILRLGARAQSRMPRPGPACPVSRLSSAHPGMKCAL